MWRYLGLPRTSVFRDHFREGSGNWWSAGDRIQVNNLQECLLFDLLSHHPHWIDFMYFINWQLFLFFSSYYFCCFFCGATYNHAHSWFLAFCSGIAPGVFRGLFLMLEIELGFHMHGKSSTFSSKDPQTTVSGSHVTYQGHVSHSPGVFAATACAAYLSINLWPSICICRICVALSHSPLSLRQGYSDYE